MCHCFCLKIINVIFYKLYLQFSLSNYRGKFMNTDKKIDNFYSIIFFGLAIIVCTIAFT